MKWGCVWTALLFMCAMALGGIYKNSELNFSIQLPERFREIPAPPNTVVAFATSDAAQGVPEVLVTVSRMHGILTNTRINTGNIPNAKLSSTRWKDCDVDVVSYRTTQDGVALAVRTAAIPLKDEAIQVNVCVPEAREAGADAALQEILANLDGAVYSFPKRDNGVDPEQLGRVVGSLVVTIVLVVVGVIIYRRSRGSGQKSVAQQGTGTDKTGASEVAGEERTEL